MDALTALLAPITPEAFVRDYFDTRPLYLRGHPEKFRDLFRPEDLRATIAGGVTLHANLGGARQLKHVDPRDIDTLIASGATLCAGDLIRTNSKLAAFAAEIGGRLGFAGRVDVRAYWSPDGHGFDTHFDARVATTLQIAGKKRWRYSKEPAVRFPADNVIGEGGNFSYMRDNPTPRPGSVSRRPMNRRSRRSCSSRETCSACRQGPGIKRALWAARSRSTSRSTRWASAP
jgi:ribosomal protein L16 Arg81 hydroxylase